MCFGGPLLLLIKTFTDERSFAFWALARVTPVWNRSGASRECPGNSMGARSKIHKFMYEVVLRSFIVHKFTYEVTLGSSIVRKCTYKVAMGSSIERKFIYKVALGSSIVRKFT